MSALIGMCFAVWFYVSQVAAIHYERLERGFLTLIVLEQFLTEVVRREELSTAPRIANY